VLSKARRRDGHSSDLTTAPLDFTSLNVLGSTPPLESLARWHLGSRRHVPAAGDHLYSPDWLILQARRPPDHLLSPDWLTVQARRHSVAQPARLDSLARFARSLASPRPRRRPLSGATTATFASGLLTLRARRHFVHLASLNSLGSTHSLDSLARWHLRGLVGGRCTPIRRHDGHPRSTRSTRSAQFARSLTSSRPRRHPRRLDGLTPLGLHHTLAGTSRASWEVELRLHGGPI